MFKKILAGLGIDAAKVNLEIDKNRVELGGDIRGELFICGGAVEQQVEEISIALVLTSQYKHEDQVRQVRKEIGNVKVADRMQIEANAPEIRMPVHFKLPYNIPITAGSTQYHLQTSLDIKNAIDPKDIDEIKVLPNEPLQRVFDALKLLGFRAKSRSGDFNGRFQQFEYIPTGFMKGKLDELEICMEAQENKVNIMMQVDKKSRGIFGKLIDDLDLDERHVIFSLSYSQMNSADQVASTLKDIIEEQYNNICF